MVVGRGNVAQEHVVAPERVPHGHALLCFQVRVTVLGQMRVKLVVGPEDDVVQRTVLGADDLEHLGFGGLSILHVDDLHPVPEPLDVAAERHAVVAAHAVGGVVEHERILGVVRIAAVGILRGVSQFLLPVGEQHLCNVQVDPPLHEHVAPVRVIRPLAHVVPPHVAPIHGAVEQGVVGVRSGADVEVADADSGRRLERHGLHHLGVVAVMVPLDQFVLGFGVPLVSMLAGKHQFIKAGLLLHAGRPVDGPLNDVPNLYRLFPVLQDCELLGGKLNGIVIVRIDGHLPTIVQVGEHRLSHIPFQICQQVLLFWSVELVTSGH